MKLNKYVSVFLFIGAFACASCLTAQQEPAEQKEALKTALPQSDQLSADLKFLSSEDLKGRETGTPESAVAREYIVKRFKESGISPFESGFVQDFSFENRAKEKISGANVIGFIKGKSEKHIVVSAHYDHLGVRRGETYNGTDDNASGTAALFALASYFKANRPLHTLIFAAFDAEEKGLSGAKHFVSSPPVGLSEIVLNINMDMISRSEKKELYVAGIYHYPGLKTLIDPFVEGAPIKLSFGHDQPEPKSDDWTSQSDHGVFHKKKIPFVYFGVEDHPDYHKPTDDFEKVDLEFYRNVVTTITKMVAALDKGIEGRPEAAGQ